jgi:hypothetical protein
MRSFGGVKTFTVCIINRVMGVCDEELEVCHFLQIASKTRLPVTVGSASLSVQEQFSQVIISVGCQ